VRERLDGPQVAVLFAPPILGALVSSEIVATLLDYLPAGLGTVLVSGTGERYSPEAAVLLLGPGLSGPWPSGSSPCIAATRSRRGLVMRAFIYEKYGPPETLRMAEVDKPAPNAGEVLVKVLAASVNAADWHVLRGKPLFSRATLGLLRPKHRILGVDIAGQVEAVGSGVTRFKPGDEVYANLLDHGYGGFAEYVAVPLDVVSLKPASLSFEEAAAVPMAAVTALQGLRHHGELQPAQQVLINGATGGVGSFAVQLAKASGTEVTAVTSTGNLDLVRSLGADHVVDYTTTDFTRSGRRYDLILDTVGNRSVPDLRRALAPGGKAAVTGFTSMRRLLGVSLRGGKDVAQVQAHVTTEDLELLSELIAAGKVGPQIDRRYRFADIPAAITYLEQGHARAKVVVAMR
jgi:NADPH:quinone reductase-like Zn-dependent oxidoreductase